MVNTLEEESSPVLGFKPEDLKGIIAPHNNALIIRVTVANYEVAWVFVNAGSSVNVLFKSALEQIRLNEEDLQHIMTPLFGFFEHAVHPRGQI